MTNIQDFTMLHVGATDLDHHRRLLLDHPPLHDPRRNDRRQLPHRINATIMDGAVIGAGSIVAGGAFVPEGKEYPPNSVIMGAPARVKAERDNRVANRMNAWLYNRNAEFYKQGRHDAWSSDDFEAWMTAKAAEVAAELA